MGYVQAAVGEHRPTPGGRLKRLGPAWLAAILSALVFVALIRIADTYHTFNHTHDEPAHIGAAMQYLDGGEYRYENQHPPMRSVYAIGPLLLGHRYGGSTTMWVEGERVLYRDGAYFRNLTAARLAALPFFALTVAIVFGWALGLGGPPAALFSALLYTSLPLALAHAGLATTDTLVTGTVTLALFTWSRVLARATPFRLLLFAVAAALAVLSKFSAIPFLGLVVVVTGIGWALRLPGLAGSFPRKSRARRLLTAAGASAAAVMVCGLVIWAGYRFSFGAVAELGPVHQEIERDISTLTVRRLLHFLVKNPIPAPEFFFGIRELLLHNSGGHPMFFMGSVYTYGHPAFFPVAVAIKTPIPFLLLSVLGGAALVRRSLRANNPLALVPPLAAVLMLLACIPSSINIGLRHLLPIFPLLAVCGGVGACRLWRYQGRLRFLPRGLLILLLSWQALSSVRAHPDYLAYFNECCRAEPHRWLVDSDLDWGQDLERLSRELRQRRVDQLHLAYFGAADPARHGLPPFRPLPPRQPVLGWIAISEQAYAMGTGSPPNDDYRWLLRHQPVAVVGKSIRLYRIE